MSESVFIRVAAGFCLEERSERPNLGLRVVGDAHWPFPDGATVAPRVVAAIDLIESDDDRCRRAGAELLESCEWALR